MQPFSREALIDRRQPAVRWSAVFAGAAVAAGTWLTLQLLFTGGALTALDPGDVDAVRMFGIGTTAGTLLAALISMFLGGLIAARLAGHFERKVSGLHGVLVWAVTSIAGIMLLASAVGSLAMQHDNATMTPPPPGARVTIEQALDPVNQRLEAQGRPTVSVDEMIDASRHAATDTDPRGFDRTVFAVRLDDRTALTRAEADEVLRQLGTRANDVMSASYALGQHRLEAMEAAENAGKGLLAAGVSFLLCLVAAVGGALVARRTLTSRRRPRTIDTSPGHASAPAPHDGER